MENHLYAIVGEHHTDRGSLQGSITVMNQAHEAGVRHLLIEGPPMPWHGEAKRWWSIPQEIEHLKNQGGVQELSEDWHHGEMSGKRPNRHGAMLHALTLGWTIEPCDLAYWAYMANESYDVWCAAREPIMYQLMKQAAEARNGHAMAIVGAFHVGGVNEAGRRLVATMEISMQSLVQPHEEERFQERARRMTELPLEQYKASGVASLSQIDTDLCSQPTQIGHLRSDAGERGHDVWACR